MGQGHEVSRGGNILFDFYKSGQNGAPRVFCMNRKRVFNEKSIRAKKIHLLVFKSAHAAGQVIFLISTVAQVVWC